MPTVDVVDLNRRKVGSTELPAEVFGCKPHTTLVHEAVVMQKACERQGTASTLRRGEVRGSGKKPWKQKHTGRARAGSVRSPVWRHGGSVFGPKPRSYAFSMPKKKYRTALQSALSSKVTEGQLFVVSSLSLEQPKTKVLAKALAQFAAGARILVIAGESQDGLTQAARNLSRVNVVTPDRLNVYDVVRAGTVVIGERDLARVKEVWA
ncbi:MAG TPA: 50S ribosomal protein L4 [Nitrospira sp.]|jgi:large subunit ribosomal protein L4|nr:50S ribosomal protein L4 [Nitrospira sp.]